MAKLTHGGARKNAGRKPLEDKKQMIPLYIYESLINEWGGMEAIQAECYEHLRGGKK
jgi:hypothetical protein